MRPSVARLVALVLPALLAAAPRPAAGAAPQPLPGGIADPGGRTGFFASAAGGIEAVDLETGDVLWESIEAQRPLLVVEDRLLAQAGTKRNRLRVLAFDLSRRGECVFESDPVVLPAWVVTGEAPGRSFAARWRLAEDHRLELTWEAHAWYAEAARPKAGQEEAARRQAEGVARIDLGSGRVELRPAEKAAAESAPPLPEDLAKKSLRWHGVVGGSHKAVVLEEDGERQRLVLRSWALATGEPEPEKELVQGKRLAVLPSLDRRHLLVRECDAPPDATGASTAKKKSECWAFTLESGLPVASLPYQPGMSAVVLLGTRAYYLVGRPIQGPIGRPLLQARTLQALDLKTGKKAWERPAAGKLLVPPVP